MTKKLRKERKIKPTDGFRGTFAQESLPMGLPWALRKPSDAPRKVGSLRRPRKEERPP